jgi:hypothetical protein
MNFFFFLCKILEYQEYHDDFKTELKVSYENLHSVYTVLCISQIVTLYSPLPIYMKRMRNEETGSRVSPNIRRSIFEMTVQISINFVT